MLFHQLQLKSKKYPFLFCLLSALLFSAGWPPLPFAPLLFLFLLPLFFVILQEDNFRKIVFYSFITFFISGIITVHWAMNVAMDFKGKLILFLFGYTLMAFLMSLPIILFGWTKNKIKSPLVWFSLPVYWMAYEYLQGHWDLAFMWLHLGLGFSCYPNWIQFYEITGRLGGTFLIVSINIVFYLLLKHWSNKYLLVSSLSLLVIITTTINFQLLNLKPETKDSAKIAVVQGNMNSYEKVTEDVFEKQYNVFEELVLSVKDQKPDLVVCSEGFFKGSTENPIVLNNIDSNLLIKSLKKISSEINAPILTGAIVYKLYYTEQKPTSSAQLVNNGIYYDAFNAAIFVSPDQPVQFYAKTKLVPFMERAPFLDQLSCMESMHLDLNKMSGSYCRTNETNVFTYKNLKIAPVICMESLFPDYVKEFVKKDANIIAIITDDIWSGNTNGPMQHAVYSVPLSIEMRKPIARSANTGVSLFVDKSGKTNNISELNQQKIILQEILLNNEKTFFVQHGNILGLISVIGSIAFIGLSFVRRKNFND